MVNSLLLPSNGTVVVIDEQQSEAMPIVKTLSKHGIACTYYSSKLGELPDQPTQFVRLLFLDLQLQDAVTDEHQIFTQLLSLLQRIIRKDNGPYFLVIWSKNYERYGRYVEEHLKKSEPYLIPACIVSFNKGECLTETSNHVLDTKQFRADLTKEFNGLVDPEDLEKIVNKAVEKIEENRSVTYEAKPNAIKIIEDHLRKGLERAGIFHLFTVWENILRTAGAITFKEIATTVDMNDFWEPNMRNVILRMAQARTGQNPISDTDALRASLTTFSYSFSEELESIIRHLKFPEYISTKNRSVIMGRAEEDILEIQLFVDNEIPKVRLLKNGDVVLGKEGMKLKNMSQLTDGLKDADNKTVADLVKRYQSIPFQINTNLHLELNPTSELVPGNVYKMEVEDEKKKQYLKTYFTNIGDIRNYTLIELEVSPICDYAQRKWKKSRLISGVIVAATSFGSTQAGDFFYPVVPTVLVDEKPYKMVFDFHLFKSLDHDIVTKRNIWFRLKRELLMDIIAKLSGHVNRPGISFMN